MSLITNRVLFLNKNVFALCRDFVVWTANSQDGTTPKAPVSTFVACSIVVTVFELITINYKLSSIFKQKCFCALSRICGLKLQMSKYLGKVCEHHKLSSETLLSSRPLKPLKIFKNGLITELVHLRSIHCLPWRSIIDKVIQLYGKKWPPTELTMVKTLSTAYKKIQNPHPEMECKCYQTVWEHHVFNPWFSSQL